MTIRIDKGLDIPLRGAPEQTIREGQRTDTVALLGCDFPGLRPALEVAEGDKVNIGQPLFHDRRQPEIAFTSPGGGTVSQINRGEKRRLQSIVIALDEEEKSESFPSWPTEKLSEIDRSEVVANLLRTGLWTALRARPYDKTPAPDTRPRSLFVTAMDSDPLGADPAGVINRSPDGYKNGLVILAHLTDGPVFVCKDANARLPQVNAKNIKGADFWGPHPAGLPGTHIHFLDPVSASKSVWYINYQDVIAIGETFTTGILSTGRVVAMAGPSVQHPRLLNSRLGVDVEALFAGELRETLSPLGHRLISGSLFSGRTIDKQERHLGRFHHQISALPETTDGPPPALFSAHGTAKKPPEHGFSFSTHNNGGPSPMVPFSGYDRVMPLDILAAPLLRALLTGDTDTAQALGCLELGEEDMALLSFVCPGKFDFAPLLRKALTQIEKEG